MLGGHVPEISEAVFQKSKRPAVSDRGPWICVVELKRIELLAS